MTTDDIARKSADTMWAEDHTAQNLGMALKEVRSGFAVLSMPVTKMMTNGHGLAHGGFIFTLADTAFAYACNSHNQRAVAQHAQISFIAPGKLGSTLTASASERQRGDRSGIYDITVRDEAGTTIAEFRGWSRSIPGTFF